MYYYAISLAIPCQLQLAIANSNYFLLNEIKTYQSGKGDKRDWNIRIIKNNNSRQTLTAVGNVERSCS